MSSPSLPEQIENALINLRDSISNLASTFPKTTDTCTLFTPETDEITNITFDRLEESIIRIIESNKDKLTPVRQIQAVSDILFEINYRLIWLKHFHKLWKMLPDDLS